MSRTTVVVTPGPRGSGPARVRVETDGPRGRAHLAARILGIQGPVVRIALVAEGALLLAGDEVDVRLRVGEGCRLEVVEPAGTVAYDMRGAGDQPENHPSEPPRGDSLAGQRAAERRAIWRVAVDVASHAQLLWGGQPFVVASGADVVRSVGVALHGTGTALLRDVLVLGRAREAGGRIVVSTTVTRDGDPVHREDLSLDGTQPRVGVLGGPVALRVVDTVSLLGMRGGGIPFAGGCAPARPRGGGDPPPFAGHGSPPRVPRRRVVVPP